MLEDPKISVIIPARNESVTIKEVINGVKPFADEVLVVDGHSTDTTREVAESMGTRVVLDKGKGKGDGLRVGIRKATGDILVFIDANGSHEPNDIPKLVQPILDGEADMVIGSRGTGGSDELHGDFPRFIRFTGSYCQNGFRAIKADVARKFNLRENAHTIEEEMVMKCLKQGYVITDVPSHEYERKYGTSTLHLAKTWYKFGWCVLKHYFF
jgi:glycosyltransferase involved in cell wall biosynthesis